jgi:hypothetical protein
MTLDLEPLHTFDTSPRPVDQVIASMQSATRVSRDMALQVAAVQRGRNEICAVAGLPLRLYQGLTAVDNPLFRQFDVDVPNVVHMAATLEDLSFEAIAWWRVLGRDFDGYPSVVRRIDPGLVQPKDPSGKPADPNSPYRYVWIQREDGKGHERVPAADMIRFDSPNPGILKANARAIRIAWKLDRITEMYADNPALREYFTDSDDPSVDDLSETEVDAFLAEYGAMRQTRPYGWLPSTVKRADVSVPSPRDLTLVELRETVNLAIANGLGVDPEDLGVSTTSRTYFNSVDKKQDKINRVYGMFMAAITDRLKMGDVTRRGYEPRYDLSEYLKSDPVTQASYWSALKGMNVVDEQWIGEQAGIDPAVTRRASAASLPAPVADDGQNRLRLVQNFDGDGPGFTFHASDFATSPAAPTVDATARTITGMAVPYGAIANKYGMKIRFRPGSLEYSDPSRMAHLMDHQTPVGFHRSVTETAAGPMVELAVLDGPPGSPAKVQRDQLLYDAEHGLYSGLSIGVDYSFDPESGDVEYMPDEDVYDVVRATWRETSSTYMPAFDDARVTQVAASLTGGNMRCQFCQQQHSPGIACATFAAQMRTNPPQPQPQPDPAPTPAPTPAPDPTPDQLSAAFGAWLRGQPGQQPQLPAGPTAVNPNPGGVARVSDPLPYRYDRKGNLRAGSNDFSTDIAIAHNPKYDGPEDRTAAAQRIEHWLEHAFGGGDNGELHLGKMDRPGDATQQQFAITPANVANLNYPQNHPEMYVDQLDYMYPMYNEFNKGTLDTVTPFVLPKFSSSSGLVTDHVSGTEPTPGAFAATAQTITPSTLSGKVEMLREVFDQGGNPQASGLIWRQMVRGWYEGIEAAIQAFFVANAASIPDITLGVAVTDAAMDQALATAISALKFIRGGDRFRKVFAQIDLFQKLEKAVDTTNRPLYPTLGAMNASGSVSEDSGTINVRGKLFVPEWATAATGSVLASSWMMDPDVVGVWVSTPKRIDLEWRVAWVDIGIWGYKALAITDFTRTRELTYDPV